MPDQNQADKQVTGQKNQSNNASAPTRATQKEEDMKENMGSGKRQDDN